MSNTSTVDATTPDHSRPRLVLRLGFAGRKNLSKDEESRLTTSLQNIMEILGHRLASLAPGIPVESGLEPKVSAFYAKEIPLMRLVTGLCEGSDAVAGRAISNVNIAADNQSDSDCFTNCIETELAAVLPFGVEAYRKSRPPSFHEEFDSQLASCAWVMELDGIYDKPNPSTKLADQRRSRAYRAQSAFLLRQSDVFIAAANPDDPGKAGGTLETVRAALSFDLPVVFIHTGKETQNIYLIEPENDFDSALTGGGANEENLNKILRNWVKQLTADPDNGLNPSENSQQAAMRSREETLNEYFQPQKMLEKQAKWLGFRFRKWVWSRFESPFQSGERPKRDKPLEPYAKYRKRATDLNYHYSGIYRGAFLLNYILAVLAVLIATASLTLLGIGEHSPSVESITKLAKASGHSVEVNLPVGHGPSWLLPLLFCLAAIKLSFVAFISCNTKKANRENWNDRAIDYRYLAERLRGMFYLPLAGSFQPPSAAPPQFASRVVRQSAVDWLFDAIVRASSPADTAVATQKAFTFKAGKTVTVSKLITLDPAQAARRVRDEWIREQAKYHELNKQTMHGLHHRMEKTAEILGWIVMIVVGLDLVIIGGEILHLLPHRLEHSAKILTPWLIFISAVLPAIIAALGGIRFQSECQRLAERSAVMSVMLIGRAKTTQPAESIKQEESGGRWDYSDAVITRIAAAKDEPATDPGAWSHDVLMLTERVATDFLQEAAEWSVLYAKELVEP